MARAYDSDVLEDTAGNKIANAVGTLYTDEAASVLVSDAWDAATAGTAITTVTTDGSGRWKVYFDTPKSYWVKWSDNGNTAYPANAPTRQLDWTEFVSSEHQAFEKASDDAGGPHRNTDSATFGAWFTFGNAPNSMGFAGTGTPAEAWAPLVLYNKFGVDDPNADIEHTTQGGAVLAAYYGPTVDDSAEAFSFGVFLKDTGTPITQTLALTGGEAIAQIEGDNHHGGSFTYPMLGFGSRINVKDNAVVDHAEGFRASTTVDAGATLTEYVAFSQPAHATASTAYGVRVYDPIVGLSSIVLDEQGGNALFQAKIAGSGGGSSAFVYVQPPDAGTLIGIRVQQAAGGTGRLQEWWADGGVSAASSISSGGLFSSTGQVTAANYGTTGNKFSTDSSGRASFGTTINTAAMLTVLGVTTHPSSATATYGIVTQPRFASTSTAAGTASYASVTTVASAFTITNTYAFYADTPSLGASSAITNNYGVFLANQGVSGVDNAYGIRVAPISGAGALNVGVRVDTSTTCALWVGGDTTGTTVTSGIAFGSGRDVTLYRSGADLLKTDDKLLAAAGIGVGNSAAATTLGSVAKKMEVFDASGSSLGFVPIYDAIT